MKRLSLLCALLSLFLLQSNVLSAQNNSDIWEKLESIAIIDQKVMMPMRDGIRLCTDIYRPKTDQKVPIIFSRTPYNFNSWGDGERRTRTAERAYGAVERGYAYVVQNERGRYFSEGEWDILGVPLTDGYDAFTWMKNQTWSNGKIGTYGCSSTAEWQMAVAALDHPAHAAMVPMGYGAGVGRVGQYFEQGNWYRGGAQQMLFTAWLYGVEHDKFKPRIPKGATQEDLVRISRFYDLAPENPSVDMSKTLAHLPVTDILKNANGKTEIYDKMILRKPNDPNWYKGGLYHDDMGFGVPSFWFCSWYDVSISPNIALFNHVRNNINDVQVADNQYLVIAPTLHCRYTRATENTIVGERSVGDARLNYDEQIYRWFDLWLKGDENGFRERTPRVQYFTMGSNKWQHADQWPPKSARMTTFYLTSGGKANSLFGDGDLTKEIAKDNAPADVFAYDPMNPVISHGGNVCCTGNAIKGEVYKLEMTPMATSNYFEKGHRIRIEISSSNFPRFTINLNTGGNNFDEKHGVVAHNKVYHSADYPSQIRLPIVGK